MPNHAQNCSMLRDALWQPLAFSGSLGMGLAFEHQRLQKGGDASKGKLRFGANQCRPRKRHYQFEVFEYAADPYKGAAISGCCRRLGHVAHAQLQSHFPTPAAMIKRIRWVAYCLMPCYEMITMLGDRATEIGYCGGLWRGGGSIRFYFCLFITLKASLARICGSSCSWWCYL